MILKGNKRAELKRIEAIELEDQMHKKGHTDFELTRDLIEELMANCPHSLTFSRADPNGYVPIEICKICGKEGITWK